MITGDRFSFAVYVYVFLMSTIHGISCSVCVLMFLEVLLRFLNGIQEVGGSIPPGSTNPQPVHSGHMVYSLYRRDGLQFLRCERVRRGLDACFLVIKESYVIVHE